MTNHPTYSERYNGFVVLFILMLIATALFIAGTATSFNTFQSGATQVTNSFFVTCATVGGTSEGCTNTVSSCSDLQALIEAGRAFSITSSIVAGLIMLAAFVRLLHNDLLLGFGRVPFIIFFVLLLCTACVMWILAFVAYADTFCGVSFRDNANNKVGPCGPLFLVGWVVVIVAFALEVTYDGASENPAPHTVSTAGGAHVMVPAASHSATTTSSTAPA